MKPATRWFDESFAPVPRFYERFARQQRFGLPSEFPLTSPYPGIDHHLSGPNITTRSGQIDRRRKTQVYCPRLSLSMALNEEVRFIQDMSKRVVKSLSSGQRYASYLHSRQKVSRYFQSSPKCQTPWSVFQDGRTLHTKYNSTRLKVQK